MSIKWVIPAALATGLGLSIACGRGHMSRGSMPGDYLAARLKLSSEQQATLHEVFKRHRPALAGRMETLVQARNAALDAGMDPAVTQEAWRAQQEQMADAAYAMAKEVRGAYLEALPVLSASQRSEGQSLLKKVHGHMEGMHGRHHAFALRFVKSRLELTDAQATAVQAILERHQTALAAKKETLHKAMATAVEAAMDPATSQAVLDQRFGTVKEAGFTLSAEVRAAYLEILPQLTPEQREAAKGLMKDFRNAVDGVRKLVLGF